MTLSEYKAFQITSCTGIGILGMMEPLVPTLIIGSFLIVLDVITAWDLSRRIKKKYRIYTKVGLGKFSSNKSGRVIRTFIFLFTSVTLARSVEIHVVGHIFGLVNIVASAFCAYTAWSVLENLSSESDVWIFKLLQKIMINKASRHLDTDLDSVIKDINEKEVERSRKELYE